MTESGCCVKRGEQSLRTIKSKNTCLCLVEVHTNLYVQSLCRVLARVLCLSGCCAVLFARVTWLKTRSRVFTVLAGHLQRGCMKYVLLSVDKVY